MSFGPGEMVEWEMEEWWCPQRAAWTLCPGPCPDGSEHGPKRIKVYRGRQVSFSALDGRSYRQERLVGLDDGLLKDW